ncbi:hypothetical protein chiPu_0033568, partial [Chiloscyllium punctatum]|nr:hypothetical protein [Chiloscyllium punctatum]
MHRQGNDVLRQPLADRQAAVGNRIVAVGRLLMDRLRIVDHGRDALRLQCGREGVAIDALGQADGVLRPHRGAAGSNARHRDEVAECARIAFGDLVARRDLVVE